MELSVIPSSSDCVDKHKGIRNIIKDTSEDKIFIIEKRYKLDFKKNHWKGSIPMGFLYIVLMLY